MLVPAVLYKEELEKKFAQQLYSDEYYYYTGYAHSNTLPDITTEDNVYRYAIVDNGEVVGWFSYNIQPDTDTVFSFGLYSFDNGNPVIGIDVLRKMEELVSLHRRVEWRMIGGNKVERHYDKFCARHNGNKVVLHDVTRDNKGNYHNECIYEIMEGVDLWRR
jgi:hypothetical protein